MWVWRLLISDYLKIATPAQLELEMTYQDCLDAHDLLDSIELALASE